MGPQGEWVKDWMIGDDPDRERELASGLLEIFQDFWRAEGLGEKSKSTVRRHSGSLHALGGHLVARGNEEDQVGKSARELLSEAVDLDEGPLLFHDHESWQMELDSTCRKLHRYLEGAG